MLSMGTSSKASDTVSSDILTGKARQLVRWTENWLNDRAWRVFNQWLRGVVVSCPSEGLTH